MRRVIAYKTREGTLLLVVEADSSVLLLTEVLRFTCISSTDFNRPSSKSSRSQQTGINTLHATGRYIGQLMIHAVRERPIPRRGCFRVAQISRATC